MASAARLDATNAKTTLVYGIRGEAGCNQHKNDVGIWHPRRGWMQPAQKRGWMQPTASLVGVCSIIISVAILCYRGILLVQLLDHLPEVSLDARRQVLLVQRRPVTSDALDGGFV